MKAFLMFKDRDSDPKQPSPANETDLIQDLELKTLLNAMAQGDQFLLDICRKAILCGSNSPEEIRYRQDVLRDCLANPTVARAIYQITLDVKDSKQRHWMGIFTRSPSGVLHSAVQLMTMFVVYLKKLKKIADEFGTVFQSEGFSRFFAMIQHELDDAYFLQIDEHLKELKFRDGVLLNAQLGDGNEGDNYTLRLRNKKGRNWIKDVLTNKSPVYSFSIADRDDAGARALSDMTDRGLNIAADALAQSAEHIESFFVMLKNELAFYIGSLNLSEQLNEIGSAIVFPVPVLPTERRHSFRAMYDVCLALTIKQTVVGNEVHADDKKLVMITGANQGGKSTFLRSIGLAQMMMQSGMFVPAEEFCANTCDGIFTHYRRKEDASMKSGKLDEELARMSAVVDVIPPHALMLFNESFAATNEREGSEIARQITSALIDRDVKVFFVTHMYEFARIFHEKRRQDTIFLRAERKSSGKRTFKLIEGEPLQSSFGEDVYKVVFSEKTGS